MTSRRHRIPWAKWAIGLGGVIIFTAILGALAAPRPTQQANNQPATQKAAVVAAPSQAPRNEAWDPDGDGDDHRTTASREHVDRAPRATR